MLSAELFAGCGGLAFGMSKAGFRHALMAEFDKGAVRTAKHNRDRNIPHVNSWPIELKDVRHIEWEPLRGQLAVISGGPPCQPFGIGGKKLGDADPRDMWPEAIRAIREARPDGFLFENVRNLAGPKFRSYLDWITEHLRRPSNLREDGEGVSDHWLRLKNTATMDYLVDWQVVNAADFGAPQIRHRVLIFGVSKDVGEPRKMPATHSRERLLWDQYVTFEYWDRHSLMPRQEPAKEQDRKLVRKLRETGSAPEGLPWVTIRDALKGLGEPDGTNNHVLQTGAKVYPGHTGSPLDLPAKALKAGDHGVPGGENMMVRDDGSVRYFTTREACRLIGLPDSYVFPGSWSESMRQIGNAVPAQLGEAAGLWLRHLLGRSN